MRYVPTTTSTTLVLLTVLSFAAMPAFGNSARTAESRAASATDATEWTGPKFATVEEAAIAALEQTDRRSIRKGRRHLYVGTIVRLGDAYGFERAHHSGETGRASWRPKARVDLGSEHVATFVVQPRTGDRRVDRLHEKFSAGQRRFVDDVDALHRPMFMLTPSGRIVRYGHTPATAVGANLVSLQD